MENPTLAPLPETVVAQLNAVSTATISYQLGKRGFGNSFMRTRGDVALHSGAG